LYRCHHTEPMIDRQLEKEIRTLSQEFPILAILGPRQSGKTTVSRKVFPHHEYVSLEDVDVREFAQNDPRGFLLRYSENVILDEIQRVPQLMSYLQSHVDARGTKGSVVITGSHNFFLMEQISQSLAGRVGISKLLPFSLSELRSLNLDLQATLFQGGYPRIYDQSIRPESFYKNYITTYIEKDIRQIKHINHLDTFMKFMRILAGRTGQELNTNTLGDECGVSHNTIREWLSVLEASFLVYRLKPFHKNYNKRIVKNPKIYFTDTGLVCSLLGIRSKDELDYHFLKGSLFETLVVNDLVKTNYNLGEPYELYFWRDNHQKEIDLIIDWGLRQFAVEIKSSSTIQEKYFDTLKYWTQLTESPEDHMYLVHGGQENLKRNNMNVVSWNSLYEGIISRAMKN